MENLVEMSYSQENEEMTRTYLGIPEQYNLHKGCAFYRKDKFGGIHIWAYLGEFPQNMAKDVAGPYWRSNSSIMFDGPGISAKEILRELLDGNIDKEIVEKLYPFLT